MLDRFKVDEFGGLVDLVDHASPVEAGSVFEGGCGVRVDCICDHQAETDRDSPKGCRRQCDDTPDMTFRLSSQVVPGTDNYRGADHEILESNRCLALETRTQRVSKAIDLSDHLSDWDLGQGTVRTTLETCQALLKDDYKGPLGPESG